ncbi:MAG: hypothetical protein IPH89_02010 [Bacteroidetes bacterium]|nr:hypothetical protein [Bacteroidota bacterium]
MIKRSIIAFATICISFISIAQEQKDTLLLLNGTTIISTIVDTTNGVTTIKDLKNRAKILLSKMIVFSPLKMPLENKFYMFTIH